MSAAGLTFRGSKCHIGLSQVTYLGHVYSAEGMGPDPQKVSAVHDWMVPTDPFGIRILLSSVYSLFCRHCSSTLPLN